MSNPLNNIANLSNSTSCIRRLSLIENDDFAFHAYKRKDVEPVKKKESAGYTNEAHFGNSQKDLSIDLDARKHCKKVVIGDGEKEDTKVGYYEPIWKYTNNASVIRYTWIRKLRSKIITDLKRHFGREVMHDRLISCLSMYVLIFSYKVIRYIIIIIALQAINMYSFICSLRFCFLPISRHHNLCRSLEWNMAKFRYIVR